MFKVCAHCLTQKPLKDFYFKAKKGYYDSYCRPCSSKLYAAYAKNNRPKTRKKSKDLRVKRRDFIVNYLATRCCVDCGEKDPVVLEFDHLPGAIKLGEVARMVQRYKMEAVKIEMSKCEVRCCNCHRRMTAARNPKHWIHRYMDMFPNTIEKQMSIVMSSPFKVADSPGLEPRQGESKSPVLPLHHEPIKKGRIALNTAGLQALFDLGD